MADENTTPDLGARVFGLAIMAMGLVCIAWGRFDPGQPVAPAFPHRAVLAYVVDGFMIAAGAAVAVRRTAALGAAALGAFYGLVVVIVINGPGLVAHASRFIAWSNVAEQLALAAAALVVYAAHARLGPTRARLLTRAGQITFGVCALLFGGAHFFYLNLTAPLVPEWLPPGQEFWALATGFAQVAAGLAIITRMRARLAAILLTVMYASFTPLVHMPLLLTNPSDFGAWTETALNLALTGAAWVVADSAPRRARA